MAAHNYLDFELELEAIDDGYRARVLNSPTGEASAVISLSRSRVQIDALIRQLGTRTGGPDERAREQATAKQLGGDLFQNVFIGEILGRYRSSLAHVHAQPNTSLRIKLRLSNAPALASLPWEMLLDTANNVFVAQSTQTPIVRYLELAHGTPPLEIEPPLQVLVMLSSPKDRPELDLKRERQLIDDAFAPMRDTGLAHVTYLEHADLRRLRRTLRRGTYHVLHFVGHGEFDSDSGQGMLLLEDANGLAHRIDGHRLGTVLRDHGPLRLAVLNTCEGARNSLENPYTSVASTFLQLGIPAVVAMQFPITDQAALVFSEEFYNSLADGLPVDAAVAMGRQAIYTMPSDIEWGTPVLYMSAGDGVLFRHAHRQTAHTRQSISTPTISQSTVTTRQQQASWQTLIDDVVQAMLGCSSMRDKSSRDIVLARLPQKIYRRIRLDDTLGGLMDSVVNTCADYPGGLDALLAAVQYMERESYGFQDVRRAVDALIASRSRGRP